MSRFVTTPLILALVSSSVLATRAGRAGDAQKAASADLSGHWTYNVQLSDDARQKMREGMEGRGGPGGGRPPMGPGGGGGGMGGSGSGGMGGSGSGGGGKSGRGGGMSGLGGDDPREAMRAIMEPPEELAITQSESEIAVDEKLGRLRRLHPDGKKYKTDNGATDIKAFWKDGKLVIETKRARGDTVETWERVPDGSRLIVNVRLEGGFGPRIELKRIYDLAPATGESPSR